MIAEPVVSVPNRPEPNRSVPNPSEPCELIVVIPIVLRRALDVGKCLDWSLTRL